MTNPEVWSNSFFQVFTEEDVGNWLLVIGQEFVIRRFRHRPQPTHRYMSA